MLLLLRPPNDLISAPFAAEGLTLRTDTEREGERASGGSCNARAQWPAKVSADADTAARPSDAKRIAAAESAKADDVDTLEPLRQDRIDVKLARRELRPQAEHGLKEQQRRRGRPRLRDARHEVVGRTVGESLVAEEPAEELRQPRVREAEAGVDHGADDLIRAIVLAVCRQTRGDHGVVMWPHRAVVVAHGVVRRIAR